MNQLIKYPWALYTFLQLSFEIRSNGILVGLYSAFTAIWILFPYMFILLNWFHHCLYTHVFWIVLMGQLGGGGWVRFCRWSSSPNPNYPKNHAKLFDRHTHLEVSHFWKVWEFVIVNLHFYYCFCIWHSNSMDSYFALPRHCRYNHAF